MKKTLVYNAIKTPDGTILVSRHRHDYVTHQDKVTGETYMLDGGQDYRRMSVNEIPAEDCSKYLEDGIEAFRDLVTWGSRGLNGDGPIKFLKLSELSDSHLAAIIAYFDKPHLDLYEEGPISKAMKMEQDYRKRTKNV